MAVTEGVLRAARERAGIHSRKLGAKIPGDPIQRTYFGLMEVLDYECMKYGDFPFEVTEEEIRAYLQEHIEEIRCGPPSWLGFVATSGYGLRAPE